MDPDEQKIDVRISNIIVNIAPAAVRILLGVSNSFGQDQVDSIVCVRSEGDLSVL